MKKKTDYQVSVRTMYGRLKVERKLVAELRSLYGAACTDNDRLKAENGDLLVLHHDDLNVISGLRDDVARLQADRRRLMESPVRTRTVDPTAEVVMGMKRAMEFSINAQAGLLDAMGELVDTVSGRKARREAAIERIDEREG